MPDTPQYLCLKQAHAAKTGERSTGRIGYSVLCDSDRQAIYLTLTANEGGGWFSAEIVALSRIEEEVATLPDRHQPLPSKFLRPAFGSKSVNNSGFLAALLRAEGLLKPAQESPQLHVLTDDWELWKSVMLAEPGVPYDPTPKGAADTPKPEIVVTKDSGKPESHGKHDARKKARQSGQIEAEAETLPTASTEADSAPDADDVGAA